MFSTDPQPSPAASAAEPSVSRLEDQSWAEDGDIGDAAPLLHLCGAAALAILALAAASIVLV